MEKNLRNLLPNILPLPPHRSFSKQEQKDQARENLLSLRGKLLSSTYKTLQVPEKMPIQEVYKFILQKFRSNIEEIDFSSNQLIDDDLAIIALALARHRFKCVDLSDNRFYGGSIDTRQKDDAALRQILEIADFVDITANPLASSGRKDLFDQLDDSELSKLIWIPYSWLDAGHWKNLVRRSSAQEVVLRIHKQYYNK